jgi:hypothetical protein
MCFGFESKIGGFYEIKGKLANDKRQVCKLALCKLAS